MPNYDYRCESCGHEQEVFQRMTADPLTDCPACGAPTYKRLIGAGAGIIFRGSGFYETDYKRSSAAKNGGGSESKGGESQGGCESKSGGEAKSDGGSKGDSASSTGSSSSSSASASGSGD